MTNKTCSWCKKPATDDGWPTRAETEATITIQTTYYSPDDVSTFSSTVDTLCNKCADKFIKLIEDAGIEVKHE